MRKFVIVSGLQTSLHKELYTCLICPLAYNALWKCLNPSNLQTFPIGNTILLFKVKISLNNWYCRIKRLVEMSLAVSGMQSNVMSSISHDDAILFILPDMKPVPCDNISYRVPLFWLATVFLITKGCPKPFNCELKDDVLCPLWMRCVNVPCCLGLAKKCYARYNSYDDTNYLFCPIWSQCLVTISLTEFLFSD